jgi:hypothetical protein
LCCRCRKEPVLEGYKVCKKCYDQNINNLKKSWGKRENHPWGADNEIIFNQKVSSESVK